MFAQAIVALGVAAAELGGRPIRTAASVIGIRGGESVIFATTSWGYTVSVMAQGLPIDFEIRPRGFLRKVLSVEGSPIELVHRIVDRHHRARLAALLPSLVELSAMGLRLEHRYGPAEQIVEAIHLASSLVGRARHIASGGDDESLARTG